MEANETGQGLRGKRRSVLQVKLLVQPGKRGYNGKTDKQARDNDH
jgi:hypothetical protein